MSNEIDFSSEELDALDRIDSELQGLRVPKKAGLDLATLSSIDPGDLCTKYRAIKASLKILVRLIRRIPKVGDKAADAIEFLMGLADIACPA